MDGGTSPWLRIEVLGPVRAWRTGTPLDLGPVKRQAVLTALALRPGVELSHDQLLDRIWGEDPPAGGHKVLPTHVNSLRRALDPPGTPHTESVIRSGKGWYSFEAGAVRLDTADLTERADEARRTLASGEPATAADQFTAALTLFRGEPLAGLSGPFADAERQRLLNRLRGLHLDRLDCLIRLGRHAEALDELAAMPVSDPYDESVVALRMRALYGAGRQAEALKVYQDMYGLLREELGIAPGEELRRVHGAVLRRDDERLLGPAPARPRRRTLNELPGDAGKLVGRETELGVLTAPSTPGAVSVMTVDGTAGVGKTALVVRAARELSADYPDGCLFVDLRAHSTRRRQSPEQALQRLLRSLDTAHGELPSDLEELTAAWRAATSPLRLLLVLDDALDADQIRPLLPAGAGSRVLVAARRRLADLDADRRITLEPLPGGDAVSLLRHIVGEDRADREPEATHELVGLCDGLPLALRIAGSRLQNRRAWTVSYLVGRMTGDEHRLGELSVGDRSVEAAFRMSYDQLTPEQQQGFRAVGLAPTVEFDALTPATMLGWPVRKTEAVLEALVDTSLVQEHRPGRYRLHDLVRVHARRMAEEDPAEAAEARRAALGLFLDAARTASDWGPAGFPTGPWPTDTPFPDWRDAEAWLNAAGGELVDVVGYAVAHGEPDYACWIAEGLCDYLVRQFRYHESRTALEIALAHTHEAADRRMTAAVPSCLGYTVVYERRYRHSRAMFARALDAGRSLADKGEEARALAGLGSVALSVGESEQAITHVTAALKLAGQVGDDWIAAMALVIQGLAHQYQRQNQEALDCFTAARPPAATGGRPRMLGRVLSCAADIHLRLEQYGEAKALLRQAVGLVEEGGDIFLCARSLTRLGTAELGAGGEPSAAIAFHQQALLQLRLLSPLTFPGYDWLEMDIRGRLGQAYLSAGYVREAAAQFQAVQDARDTRTGRGRTT
ncbi:BTAD domain-containing putative transcriptional regulator [Streptomyces sp. NPDC057257]|uniref:AfsR/SARP family transcriptional regulator n=1 Tax=Streptomyces sp. NPDC057257 TaxID=3346071 RepID=UPI00362E76E6